MAFNAQLTAPGIREHGPIGYRVARLVEIRTYLDWPAFVYQVWPRVRRWSFLMVMVLPEFKIVVRGCVPATRTLELPSGGHLDSIVFHAEGQPVVWTRLRHPGDPNPLPTAQQALQALGVRHIVVDLDAMHPVPGADMAALLARLREREAAVDTPDPD